MGRKFEEEQGLNLRMLIEGARLSSQHNSTNISHLYTLIHLLPQTPSLQVKSEWKVAAQQQFVRRIKGEREM